MYVHRHADVIGAAQALGHDGAAGVLFRREGAGSSPQEAVDVQHIEHAQLAYGVAALNVQQLGAQLLAAADGAGVQGQAPALRRSRSRP